MCPTIALSVIMASGLLAGPSLQPGAWSRLTAVLGRADTVLIELDGARTARGGYVSSDDVEIVIWADGHDIRVPRSQVVRMIKLTRTHRHGTLIGAAIGGALAASLFASSEDLTTGGRVLFTSVGTAAGAAIGSRADHYQKREIVYVRP
jgi:Glycine zipper 2TM domain